MNSQIKVAILHQLYLQKALGEKYATALDLSKPLTFIGENLKDLEHLVAKCNLCALSKTRKKVIFGHGKARAKVMFIGSKVSANDEINGKLFSGKSGIMLENITKNVLKLNVNEVYITSLLKCKIPENNHVKQEYILSCKNFLYSQIRYINPQIIVTLGEDSFYGLIDEKINYSQALGEIFYTQNIKLLPTYDLTFILQNPSYKKEVLNHMLRVKSLL